jgi:hypothetical protein
MLLHTRSHNELLVQKSWGHTKPQPKLFTCNTQTIEAPPIKLGHRGLTLNCTRSFVGLLNLVYFKVLLHNDPSEYLHICLIFERLIIEFVFLKYVFVYTS